MVPQGASIEAKGLHIFDVFLEGGSSSGLALLATIFNSWKRKTNYQEDILKGRQQDNKKILTT